MTWVSEEEPITALGRKPRGLEQDEEEPGIAQAASSVTNLGINIFFLIALSLYYFLLNFIDWMRIDEELTFKKKERKN